PPCTPAPAPVETGCSMPPRTANYEACESLACVPIGPVPSPEPSYHGHFRHIVTGRLSSAFWGPPTSVEGVAARRQAEAMSGTAQSETQSERPAVRRGPGGEVSRRMLDRGIKLRERPLTKMEALRKVVALHVAVLGEGFLPARFRSVDYCPMAGGPKLPLVKDQMVSVPDILELAIKSRENIERVTKCYRWMGAANGNARFLLRMGKSEVQGHGVFAKQAIPAEMVIAEFEGEGIDSAEAKQRASHYGNMGFYGSIVQVGDDPLYVDALRQGYPARFANHSCEPNAYLQTVVCGMGPLEHKRVWFCSSRDIAEGEEVCFSYPALHSPSPDNEEPDCNCGSPSCRGKMFQRYA
ncbi:unnamed protein product, partial [Ectocarpus fasciculatus]